jgi:hypothetical protein
MVVAAFELADDAVAAGNDAADTQIAHVAVLDAASEGFGPGGFRTQPAEKLPQGILPESEFLGGRDIFCRDDGKLSDGGLLLRVVAGQRDGRMIVQRREQIQIARRSSEKMKVADHGGQAGKEKSLNLGSRED